MAEQLSERQLAILRQERTVLRTSATKNLKVCAESYQTVVSANLVNADTLLKRLRDIKIELGKKNELIHLNIATEGLNTDIERSLEYAEKLSDAIAMLETQIHAVRTSSVSQGEGAHGSQTISKNGPKLPKMELSTFDGDPLLWESFWDDFESSVHLKDEISTINKFKYLRQVLKGDALRVADGYLLTAANYSQVIDELKDRFGDKQVAIFAHFEKLLALAPASHNLADLRKVHDACESHIRSLVALGLSEDTFGQVFVPILLSKFPKFVKMELHRRNGSSKWTLPNLRSLLKDEIRARDKSEYQPAEPKSKDGSQGKAKGNRLGSASTLIVSGSKPGQGGGPKQGCSFCQGAHPAYKCSKYPDYESRQGQMSGRCLSCLAVGHSLKDCKRRRKCYYCTSQYHHSALCKRQFSPASTTPATPHGTASTGSFQPSTGHSMNPTAPTFAPKTPTVTFSQTPAADNSGLANFCSPTAPGYAVMKSARAVVVGEQSSATAQFVFDDGSTLSFATAKKLREIGAKPICTKNTAVSRFGDQARANSQYRMFLVNVRLPNGNLVPLVLHETPSICAPIQVVPMDIVKFPFIAKMPLAQPLVGHPTMVNVDILIGLDYYYTFIGVEYSRLSNGVVFLDSTLGFIASGYSDSPNGAPIERRDMQMLIVTDPKPSFDVEKFWELESVGIKNEAAQTDDEYAQAHFENRVRFHEGRYYVGWPYKFDCPPLPDNFSIAHNRLRSQQRQLVANPLLLEHYESTFANQISRGIIEEAPQGPQGLVYYMPHHAVFKPRSATTKIRIVYDASAKSKGGKSLNDCLLKGPLILSDLVGCILRFRLHPVALISDIEKAFHMVGLHEDQRDVTRFLWIKDPLKPVSPDNTVIFRFCRVPFGTIASSFLLAATIVHHLKSNPSAVAEDILDNLYVDNVLGGVHDSEAALRYYHEAKRLFAGASMNLRQWFSNSQIFNQNIDSEDFGETDTTSVLGIQWSTRRDTLSSPAHSLSETENESTKREILSALASLFDPCGWFSPVTTACRLLMQELWKSRCHWDEKLPDDLLQKWQQLKSQLLAIPSFTFPRFLGIDRNTQRFELHCFVDASSKAYASVVYLRAYGPSGQNIVCHLLCAKSRVAPIKPETIPRLELLAALIGSRLTRFVASELKLPLEQTFLWSDSKCVLAWIQSSEKKLPVFIQNRVREIRGIKDLRFRYVPSADNPADIPSRGVSLDKFSESAKWWNGPDWLQRPAENWPVIEISTLVPPDDGETADSSLIQNTALIEDDFIDLSRFSSARKLFRVTCFVRRFVDRLVKRDKQAGVLTAAELRWATTFWIKRTQRKHFSDLSLDSNSSRKSQSVTDLNLFLDDMGIIRSRGRIKHSHLSFDTDNPILLPKNDPLTTLIIRDTHVGLVHAGMKHTLSKLRETYWVPSARVLIKRVTSECNFCRRFAKRTFQIPMAPPLPPYRVASDRAFAYVGLDYIGPLYVQKGGNQEKVWICLITCPSSRAIHLEVAHSLSAVDFLFCLRRFIALFGSPKLIISDNASQFKATQRSLKGVFDKCLRSDEVQNFAANQGIAWKFITELSPWFGGFYERLVSPAKSCLKKSLDQRCVSVEELQTLCYEIAAVLNSRPLVHSEDEVGDQALTPAMLLARSGFQFPDVAIPDEHDDYRPLPQGPSNVVQQYKRMQKILNAFWNDWRQQYLTSIRERHHEIRQRNTSTSKPQIGQVVSIKDVLPRGQWRYGVISDLVHSNDGQCRTVKITLPNRTVIYRPIRLLYPLESSVLGDQAIQTQKKIVSRTNDRPPRSAASLAGARIKGIFAEESA